MTTQAQAPTEEMLRDTAAEIAIHLGLSSEYAVRQITAALAAQDRLAVGRCAKWHERQELMWVRREGPEYDGVYEREDCRGRGTFHRLSAAALRAQGEK